MPHYIDDSAKRGVAASGSGSDARFFVDDGDFYDENHNLAKVIRLAGLSTLYRE